MSQCRNLALQEDLQVNRIRAVCLIALIAGASVWLSCDRGEPIDKTGPDWKGTYANEYAEEGSGGKVERKLDDAVERGVVSEEDAEEIVDRARRKLNLD